MKLTSNDSYTISSIFENMQNLSKELNCKDILE